MKSKLQVGQKVFIKPTGNAARRNTDILESQVYSIGKKYFTLLGSRFTKTKFCLERMHDVSEYSPNWVVYVSEQEIIDERDLSRLRELIKNHPFTVDQLREIESKFIFQPSPLK